MLLEGLRRGACLEARAHCRTRAHLQLPASPLAAVRARPASPPLLPWLPALAAPAATSCLACRKPCRQPTRFLKASIDRALSRWPPVAPPLRWSIQDVSEPELVRRWSMDDAIALGENAFSSSIVDGNSKPSTPKMAKSIFCSTRVVLGTLNQCSYRPRPILHTCYTPGQAEKEVKP